MRPTSQCSFLPPGKHTPSVVTPESRCRQWGACGSQGCRGPRVHRVLHESGRNPLEQHLLCRAGSPGRRPPAPVRGLGLPSALASEVLSSLMRSARAQPLCHPAGPHPSQLGENLHTPHICKGAVTDSLGKNTSDKKASPGTTQTWVTGFAVPLCSRGQVSSFSDAFSSSVTLGRHFRAV